jgi:CDP-diacylglycerol--serine O-phosphatidyltransferase
MLPTLFTLGNLVCGFFSIVVAARVDAPTSKDIPLSETIVHRAARLVVEFDPTDPNHNVVLAVGLIFIAMAFDALDGHVARLARSTSDFGAQLDSLGDLVSFGVAPAFLLVKMCPSFTYMHKEAVWAIAALYAACAAMRLARFNVETTEDDDHLHFKGLPTPAAAATIASFAVLFYTLRNEASPLAHAAEIDVWVQRLLPCLAVLVSLLMVSRIPYPHVINQLFHGHRSFAHLVKLVFAVVAAMIAPGFSLPVIFVSFVLACPLKYLWVEYVMKRPHEEPLF